MLNTELEPTSESHAFEKKWRRRLFTIDSKCGTEQLVYTGSDGVDKQIPLFNPASATHVRFRQLASIPVPALDKKDLEWVCKSLRKYDLLDNVSEEAKDRYTDYESDIQTTMYTFSVSCTDHCNSDMNLVLATGTPEERSCWLRSLRRAAGHAVHNEEDWPLESNPARLQ